MNRKKVAITLGIMCLLLTLAIAVQYKTIKNANTFVGTSGKNSELKSEVLIWKEKYDEEYKKLEAESKILDKEREKASKRNTNSSEIERSLKIANAVIGTTDVEGQGIILTVADNKNVTNESISIMDNISNYLIHDNDLLTLVNELKNAGAEAISINGKRIVNTTAISCDGNVIVVNGEKIGTPIEISAIGLPEQLSMLNRPGGTLEYFVEDGKKVNFIKNQKVEIPKYTGVFNFKYAKTVK